MGKFRIVRVQAIACVGAAMLLGCARPSERIAVELRAQGLDPAFATCVGERMEQRLSVSQLLRLRDVIRRYRARVGERAPIDFSGLMAMAQDIGDPQIPIETVAAGVSCGMR